MIAYLEGEIISKKENELTINVNGVGYLLKVPLQLARDIQVGDQAKLHVYTRLTQDNLALYGFSDSQQRELFVLLLSISGVGPKVALSILSVPYSVLQAAVANKDSETMAKIPGIGPKTAQRIILELKGKLDLLPATKESGQDYRQDAISALCSLGYDRIEVVELIAKAPTELEAVEEIVRWVLSSKK